MTDPTQSRGHKVHQEQIGASFAQHRDPKLSNAISVDVEEHFHVSAFADSLKREDWEKQESRVERNTDILLKLFDETAVRCTFFVLGKVAESHPALVKRISDLGHEVACHGYSHELVYRQSRSDFEAETYKSKSILEDITGKPISGYRAASYSITAQSVWAIDILAEMGFSYDSSIFPVRHDRYGMPGAPRFPFIARTEHGSSLIEFPLTTLSIGPMRVPIAGGGYFRLFPYRFTEWSFRRINRENQPIIFYLHPWEIDHRQPRIEANFLSTFRHYNNLHKTQDRLRRLLRGFSFGTVIDSISNQRITEEFALQPSN